MATVRPAAVAGMFYPSKPRELDASVQYYLAQAAAEFPAATGPVPKAIIAPHAGYIYSGLTAAAAYARLKKARGTIKRVVMMGPCHRVAVKGLALSGADEFATPLGKIPVDKAAVDQVLGLPGVEIFDATHAEDHCLEVHLPFLQVVLDEFAIVPFIVGDATPEQVAAVLGALWGGPETLILISSDLSHYLSYDEARAMDDETRQAVERMDTTGLDNNHACGRHSMRGLFEVARGKGLQVTTAHVCNSGDTAGAKDRVVGYGSWLFVAPDTGAPDGQKPKPKQVVRVVRDAPAAAAETRVLLKNHGSEILYVASASIIYGVNHGGQRMIKLDDFRAPLRANGACFVTLNLDGKLRGCVGSLAASRPLIADVADNGYKAAFRDTRFKPLTRDELLAHKPQLSVSVLSPQTPMTFKDEDDLLSQLRPGIDGLLIADQGKRAVFLPVVWEGLPDPKEFMAHLKKKAGLKENHWSDSFQAWRYTSESIYSDQLDDPAALWREV